MLLACCCSLDLKHGLYHGDEAKICVIWATIRIPLNGQFGSLTYDSKYVNL